MTTREGFHCVTPCLPTPDLDGLLGFVKHAFGAAQTHRDRGGNGGHHVEVRIGDSMPMIGGPVPSVSSNRPANHTPTGRADAP